MARQYTKRVFTHNTDLVETRWDTCPHSVLWRKGHSLNGKVKWQCPFCLANFTEQGRDDHMTRVRRLGPLYRDGILVAEAQRRTGYARKTISRYFALFREVYPRPCACGRPRTHKGTCFWRRHSTAASSLHGILPRS